MIGGRFDDEGQLTGHTDHRLGHGRESRANRNRVVSPLAVSVDDQCEDMDILSTAEAHGGASPVRRAETHGAVVFPWISGIAG